MIRENCLQIGYFSKPHGVEGNIILRLSGNFADEIEPGEPLFVEIDGTLVPFFIEEITPFENKAIVKLEFISSEPEAVKICSCPVYIQSDAGNFEMAGAKLYDSYSFIDELTGIKGTITDFIPGEYNPTFVVKTNNRESLIPASDDFIVKIDKQNKIIYMKLPEGLLDL